MEAAVEAPTVPTRYFCHMCNVEINIPNTDFTCPLCASGFVEELPPNAPLGGAGGPSGSNSASSLASTGTATAAPLNRISNLNALRGEIATLLMSRNGPNVEISIDPGRRGRANLITLGGNNPSSTSVNSGGTGNNTGTAGGRVRPQNLDRLDNVLLDFLQSISGGDIELPFGNSNMFYMGNLGDYAWGRDGIDTIVTQLLNQMETSGPPPLSKDKIDEIPKVKIANEEIELKLQCSVCWEDFQLDEIVRKLPCTHLYHEDCIVPWLDLHGTCPICRKSLSDENTGTGGEIQNNSVGNNEATTSNNAAARLLQSNLASGSGIANSRPNGPTNNTGSNSTSQAQEQRNNIFAFDDSNMDLD